MYKKFYRGFINYKLLLIACGLLWAVSSYASSISNRGNEKNSKMPCIICIGQSNADGRVPMDNLPDYISLPMNNSEVSFRTSDGSFQILSKENFLVLSES